MTTRPYLNRRSLMLAAAASSIGMPVLAQGRPIRFGCTVDASGVEKANGTSLFLGASACVEGINRAGGLQGRPLELVMADDQFKPELARENALRFQGDPGMIGLISPLGTRQTAAVMEAVHDMAIVGPNTGTAALRKVSPPNLFWVRASYDEEVDALIENAATVGITRIGVVYPNDALGKGVFAAIERPLAARKIKPVVVATTPSTISTEVGPAAQQIAAAAPQLVLMVLAGVLPLFVAAFRKAGGHSTLYGLSIGASAANLHELGEQARGIGFAIVVPSPFSPKHEIVRRYQADMAAAGSTAFSLPTLEGYINARITWEALRRAGPQVTREGLIDALAGLTKLDLGGMTISYGRDNRIGGRFVDIAVIGTAGRILS